MKIKFNGLLEKRGNGKGCNCHKQANSEYGYVSTKMFILPSGQTRTFYAGRVETVSDTDGNFLLSYAYTDVNGAYREVFSRVEDDD